MTDKLFFDTDCISSFLWVKQENLLLQLYPGRIILPQEVFTELSHPSIPHIRAKITELLTNGIISTMPIMTNTEEYLIYYELAITPPIGRKKLGKGEAAALALAKTNNAIIASNNLSDISQYVSQFSLRHVTTSIILVQSFNNGLIDENAGNQIWDNLIRKRRLMPAPTFTNFLKEF